MKNYQSTNEGIWIEVLNPDLTQEFALLHELLAEQQYEAANDVQNAIKIQREGAVSEEKLTELNTVYQTHKPKIPDGISYQLIAMDVSEIEGEFRGILNCRVDGEHKQVRF